MGEVLSSLAGALILATIAWLIYLLATARARIRVLEDDEKRARRFAAVAADMAASYGMTLDAATESIMRAYFASRRGGGVMPMRPVPPPDEIRVLWGRDQ